MQKFKELLEWGEDQRLNDIELIKKQMKKCEERIKKEQLKLNGLKTKLDNLQKGE
jgi:hypothetical protein